MKIKNYKKYCGYTSDIRKKYISTKLWAANLSELIWIINAYESLHSLSNSSPIDVSCVVSCNTRSLNWYLH